MSEEVNGKLYGHGLVQAHKPPSRGPLKDRHVMPPFSVWNTRDDKWQGRRNLWKRLGIQSELGRVAVSYHQESLNDLMAQNKRREPGGGGGPNSAYQRRGQTDADGGIATGTSIFDPLVCELCYGWWCPPAGVVLDPFAGGSVRGVVASVMGLRYWGSELRAEQVDANRAQVSGPDCPRVGRYKPRWVCGDSYDNLPAAPLGDFLFSCPPYGDLEQYSDDPADLSSMAYPNFKARYWQIIQAASDRLRDDSFAVFVVANYRDRATGYMRDLVGDTTAGFQAAGLQLYNEVILVNSVGSGAVRVGTSFIRGCRKVVKLHQNVLVYVKGCPSRAAARIGDGAAVDAQE